MRRFCTIAAAAAVACALVVVPLAAAKTVTIQITKTGFSPATATIAVGDTVVFKNADTTAHQVKADNGAFQTPTLQPGQSSTQKLSSAGTYPYHDVLHATMKGTLQVFAQQVSINASKQTVTFGKNVRLSGNVSSGVAGQKVTVQRRLCGNTDFGFVGDFLTQNLGRWFMQPKPLNNTEYKAVWNNAEDTVMVNVRPQLQLAVLSRGHFSLKASAFAQSFRGRYAWVQRFKASNHSWRNVKRVFFKTVRAGSHQTRISSVAFAVRIRHGLYLRAFMPQSQVGDCYVAGQSNTVRS